MASKSLTSLALFLAINLLSFNLTAANPASQPTSTKCPVDSLKINLCVNVLNKLVNLELPNRDIRVLHPCCPLIKGLIDVEAAVCLCTSLRLTLLGGSPINIPLKLSLPINAACNGAIPAGFQCPPLPN